LNTRPCDYCPETIGWVLSDRGGKVPVLPKELVRLGAERFPSGNYIDEQGHFWSEERIPIKHPIVCSRYAMFETMTPIAEKYICSGSFDEHFVDYTCIRIAVEIRRNLRINKLSNFTFAWNPI